MGNNMPLLGDNQTQSSPLLPSIDDSELKATGHAYASKVRFHCSFFTSSTAAPNKKKQEDPPTFLPEAHTMSMRCMMYGPGILVCVKFLVYFIMGNTFGQALFVKLPNSYVRPLLDFGPHMQISWSFFWNTDVGRRNYSSVYQTIVRFSLVFQAHTFLPANSILI
jgi:hypothetical protein